MPSLSRDLISMLKSNRSHLERWNWLGKLHSKQSWKVIILNLLQNGISMFVSLIQKLRSMFRKLSEVVKLEVCACQCQKSLKIRMKKYGRWHEHEEWFWNWNVWIVCNWKGKWKPFSADIQARTMWLLYEDHNDICVFEVWNHVFPIQSIL